MTNYTIHQGNALDVLRSMESESVQCSITSPPYYGLRSYKTEPQIWDGDEFCDHEWGNERIKPVKLQAGNPEFQRNWREQSSDVSASQGSFCRCGAWRGELGLEPTFQLYLSHLLQIFTEVKRVVKADGTIWVNLGDSYVGGKGQSGGASAERQLERSLNGESLNKAHHNETAGFGITRPGDGKQSVAPKSLMNIPHRFFIMLTDELGLIQRNNINWWKRACMPSSAKDRFTVDFESIGFFTKSARYKFNQILEPLAEISIQRVNQPNYENQNGSIGNGGAKTNGMMKAVLGSTDGRNCRTTWDFGFEPQSNEHYAAYPSKMCDRMILAGSDEGDTVLDIFSGTASTGLSALRLKRNFCGVELNPDYIKIAEKRLAEVQVKLFA